MSRDRNPHRMAAAASALVGSARHAAETIRRFAQRETSPGNAAELAALADMLERHANDLRHQVNGSGVRT